MYVVDLVFVNRYVYIGGIWAFWLQCCVGKTSVFNIRCVALMLAVCSGVLVCFGVAPLTVSVCSEAELSVADSLTEQLTNLFSQDCRG